ncbi:DUF6124 family protein [Pseudomonas batumici]|uniref:DUF3077 domain-containing protein n=1 Tax=Pseudomonas batumici TaxID=226910 RepID=A0A0C2F2K9_9PSED|nr:hypothetical protein [Pseudomonas batumici]KIH85263.1 hypothetical protein UCMB321_1051 [Pseudomonas batumici]
MFKITPDPSATSSAETIDPQAADRAFAHYDLGPHHRPKSPRAYPMPPSKSREEALVNAYSVLQSAAATAYEHADNQTGSSRQVAMGIVHLIELARRWVDSVLDEQPDAVTN